MSRLSIEITNEEHKQIKAMAALQGKSIKEFVMERLFLKSRDTDSEWLEFISFIQDRVKKAQEAEPIDSSFTDIANEHLKKLKKSK